jgi:Ser/Thr protein kinase RdoA (MazF antagonist)
VRRPTGPWTPTVHALLQHLDRVGFAGAPKVLGLDADGREILTFIEGDPGSLGYPAALLDVDGVVEFGRFVRRYHDAVASFVPPSSAVWRVGTKPVAPGEIVCHGDLGHWNTVWRDGRLVGAIDWDFAEPDSPLRDLASVATTVVPLVDDEKAHRMGFREPPERRRRLALLCDAYEDASPPELLDAVVRFLRTEVQRLTTFGLEGREPWASLMERGMADALRERLAWIEASAAALTRDC